MKLPVVLKAILNFYRNNLSTEIYCPKTIARDTSELTSRFYGLAFRSVWLYHPPSLIFLKQSLIVLYQHCNISGFHSWGTHRRRSLKQYSLNIKVVVSCPGDASMRQALEAVIIRKEDPPLNRKQEWTNEPRKREIKTEKQ